MPVRLRGSRLCVCQWDEMCVTAKFWGGSEGSECVDGMKSTWPQYGPSLRAFKTECSYCSVALPWVPTQKNGKQDFEKNIYAQPHVYRALFAIAKRQKQPTCPLRYELDKQKFNISIQWNVTHLSQGKEV